jgi:hypothetical protein
MKRTDMARKEQRPKGRELKKPQGVSELTDQDLGRVQGGYPGQNPGNQGRN